MASCDKAGRNKKSPSNTNYKAVNKLSINKKRNETRAKKIAEQDASKKYKVARGTARASRRAAASNFPGENFPEKWAAFRKLEAERNTVQS